MILTLPSHQEQQLRKMTTAIADPRKTAEDYLDRNKIPQLLEVGAGTLAIKKIRFPHRVTKTFCCIDADFSASLPQADGPQGVHGGVLGERQSERDRQSCHSDRPADYVRDV